IIFFRILSLWLGLLFVLIYLLIFPSHLIFLQFKTTWAYDVSHRLNMFWGWTILTFSGIFLRPIGRKKINRKQPYIFAPNHTSFLDIPICNVSIQNSFRFIGKAELNTVPLLGYMFKRLHIPVNRGSRTDSYRSFVSATEKLREGRSILVFPEGTIPDKKKVTLLRFKDGAFRMAIENKTPIVPVTILKADRAMEDDGKWLVRPTVVTVIFHDPIETSDMEMDDMGELKRRVYELIYETLKENGGLRGKDAEEA
ncbi:MAG TPA: 1-acyl-sn-glycerol-3-phosphate acyltransferase, partial [Bacteroidetes bacterium]|nr:1-acyl-sn-glycerol-3-phosphate acyltransferase [Bacteroidota bacterium]